ncbi:Hypothetical protein CAP_5873 [Chondromyces apiculatus DSM 436]|uniref:Uncharacterized protein n=1 Tax=Chondromyces apiculatus DSM 436 TaxID=1192034 RepID=A0A017TFQ8_9BACT|nr:Hypothetical protein CAP_5873 [Chondromyces apiculatus DSM 436]
MRWIGRRYVTAREGGHPGAAHGAHAIDVRGLGPGTHGDGQA